MSPSHLSPSQGGSAVPAPAEEIWVLRKPFAGRAGTPCWHTLLAPSCALESHQEAVAAPVGCGCTKASSSPGYGAGCHNGISSLYIGGDRSSLGSTGSVASARSSGSGQSAGSGAHALHAGSEGVKVR